MPHRSICVYCGSNTGTRPEYAAAAKAMGEALAERGLTLVYGGGKVGLMGAVADAALAAGGRCNGAPGLRDAYGPGYFAGYVIDPEGHRLEAVHRG